MKHYKMISAKEFLDALPYWIRHGYQGTFCELYISHRFFKKIIREMSTGSSIANVYIFNNGYTLSTSSDADNQLGLYLASYGSFYNILMFVIPNPIVSTKTLTLYSGDKVRKGDRVYFF